MPLLISFFALAFTALCWWRFEWAIKLLILLLPAYLIRFRVGPLPSTILELAFGIVFLVWLIKFAKNDLRNLKEFAFRNRWLMLWLVLFSSSSIVSIFVSDMWWFSFGQWRAYFLEPIIFFLIVISHRNISKNDLFIALIFSTISIAFFGIVQKFTGWALPTEEWREPVTRRITSFFSSPNAVGLFLGPIFYLVVYKIINSFEKTGWKNFKIFLYSLTLLSILIATYFTKSVGTWTAMAVGLLIFFSILLKKKVFVLAVLVLLVMILFSDPIRTVIVSKNRSLMNRVILWEYSWEYLSSSPKNFVLGSGIRQFFRKIQKPHYDPNKIERLIYPHNIFLNFWTEIGLLGMVAFMGLLSTFSKYSWQIAELDNLLGAALVSSLVVFAVHGLIDVPYFKNDLAFLFFALSALIIKSRPNEKNT